MRGSTAWTRKRLLERLSGSLQDGVFPGRLLPAPYGHIHVAWINLNAKSAAADLLGSDDCRAGTGKCIQNDRPAAWPAPGSEDTELGVLMELEVGHGETEVYPRVQA